MNDSGTTVAELLFTPVSYLFDPRQRIYIPYLCASFLIAVFVGMWEDRQDRKLAESAGEPGAGGTRPAPKGLKKILSGIFPRSMYLHRSAVVDYCYFLSNTIFYAALSGPSVFSFYYVSQTTFGALSSWLGVKQGTADAGILISLAYSIVIILAFDLALFLAHMIQHEIPFLWNFHKVHHSAEVLTPITVYRMHPIDDMIGFVFTGLFTGVSDGLFRYFVSWHFSPILVGGLNVFLFVFYLASYHLRHSHVWLSYGPFWSKVFVSPAQHQIHHSTKKKHWDKNYGFIFSFWDLAYGSLYVPKKREQITFGVGDGRDGEFSNFALLYWIPFRDAFKMAAARFTGGKEAPTIAEAAPRKQTGQTLDERSGDSRNACFEVKSETPPTSE